VAKSRKKALLQSEVLRVCLCRDFSLHEIKGQASRWDPRRASPWLIFALRKKTRKKRSAKRKWWRLLGLMIKALFDQLSFDM
jgi:hypothetical protein